MTFDEYYCSTIPPHIAAHHRKYGHEGMASYDCAKAAWQAAQEEMGRQCNCHAGMVEVEGLVKYDFPSGYYYIAEAQDTLRSIGKEQSVTVWVKKQTKGEN